MTAPEQAKKNRGRKRRRVTPVWKRRWALATAGVLALGLCLGGGWWLARSGLVPDFVAATGGKMMEATAHAGLAVQDIQVVGRQETPRADLLDALGIGRGAPMLAFDPVAARTRIEALPWVRTATVERRLPDTVFLRLAERKPMAIWQFGGQHALIDREGTVIDDIPAVARYEGLLVVVGEDAPEHTADLLRTLDTQPRLRGRVRAAVRVGNRRWNLHFDNGVDVRLPEEDTVAAWGRLAEIQKVHDVLGRDVRVLDLRLPDRLILRLPDRPGRFGTGPGREA